MVDKNDYLSRHGMGLPATILRPADSVIYRNNGIEAVVRCHFVKDHDREIWCDGRAVVQIPKEPGRSESIKCSSCSGRYVGVRDQNDHPFVASMV